MPANNNHILSAIARIDAQYEPDEGGVIDVIGTTADGRQIDLWVCGGPGGPVIEPGASFLPYGGIYYNPWPLRAVREA